MPEFSYKATDGEGRIVQGRMESPDAPAVVASLREKGLVPIRISAAGERKLVPDLAAKIDFSRLFNRISGRDVALFTQDLATLLGAGLPVDRALGILVNAAAKPPLRRIVQQIKADVQSGVDLSDALAKHPRVFSRFYANMVKAGESGGVLEPVLERMGQYLESTQELLDTVKSALIYPAFLVFLGGISIIVLLTVVIPKFSIIFADLGVVLPLSTRILLFSSELLRRYAWLLLAAMVLAAVGFLRYRRSPAGAMAIDGRLIRAPLTGALLRNLETARFARTLGTLLQSGVPILKSLMLVKDIMHNRVVAQALETVHARVKEGERLSTSLAAPGLFPDLAIQMILVGEETGRLDRMLLRVAESYEKTVRTLIKRLIGLLEPAMILVMGVVVGFIVISMLTAIFSVNELPF